MRHPVFEWIEYDCVKVPNEICCSICGEKVVIMTPARSSTLIHFAGAFGKRHMHIDERYVNVKEK